MMSKHMVLAGAALAILGAGIATAQERLPRECRQEIVKLCGTERSTMRECLREKRAKLSSRCEAELRERVQSRQGKARNKATTANPSEIIAYGPHERQAVDFYAAETAGDAPPLILFIHGGGWSFGDREQAIQQKPGYFTGQGYAFASAGYRLTPDAPVEQQAYDIGRAIAALRDNAENLGFDPDRIVLMGHSAGAHLAALVSTDPQYAGPAMTSIRGAILLDGAGYDVSSQTDRSRQARRLYGRVFGDDEARQAALSPINHAGAPDAPNWLLLYVADRDVSRAQSEALGEQLRLAGNSVDIRAVSDTNHRGLNQNLGAAGDPATRMVDAFLGRVFD